MVLWLGFNLAETTSARPLRGGQAQQEPNLVKSPLVEAEGKENPARGEWQEAHHDGNRDSKKMNSAEKLTWLSLRFEKTSS